MPTSSSVVKKRYTIFIVSVVVVILATQLVIQYDLRLQNPDAQLINQAGRQRLLNQQIVSLALQISKGTGDATWMTDSLASLSAELQRSQQDLIQKNRDDDNNRVIDADLTKNLTNLSVISACADNIAENPTRENAEAQLEKLMPASSAFLVVMEQTVSDFQKEAEGKLDYLKLVEWILSAIVVLIILTEFIFIFLPNMNRLTASNRKLIDLNKELRDVQNKLIESEQLYRLISDNASDLIVLTDVKQVFHFVSKGCRELLGYTQEELLDKPISDLVHPDDVKLLQQSAIELSNKDEPVALEFRMHHKKGIYVWVESYSRQWRRAGSNELLIQSSLHDITARRIAEFRLEQSEKLYRLLSENSRDVVSLHNIEGKFEYISPSCIDLHGYTPEELIGRSGAEFIHPEDAKEIERSVPNILEMMQKGIEVEPMQFRIMTKNRGAVWAENMIKPIFTDGKLSGFQSTVRDISSRKQYELALREAKEQAEYATKAKSQFLSMMSHEIRTPLNAILGLTNLLIGKESRKWQLDHLNLLKFSGESLLTIINDILDFSKIEADKVTLEFINFDLHDLLEKTIKMYYPRAIEKRIKLKYQFPSDVYRYVVGDPVRMGQIVTNLVGNAIKFTQEGSVIMAVYAVGEDEKTMTCRVEVTDTGIGIPEDKLTSIFDSFSQAEVTTTRRFGGSGLGLSITKYLLERMGGKIAVESKPGVGSKFYFTITLVKGHPIIQTERTSKDFTDLFRERHIRVLVVDDNKTNQIVACGFLENWNITAEVASNGKEAVEMAKSKSFNLILMDLQMPEMSGYEATALIRAMNDEYFQTLPIVALTASAVGDVKSKVIAAGMTDCVTKPFQPHELQRVIAGYVLQGTSLKISGEEKPTLADSLQMITNGDKEFRNRLLKSALENLTELRNAFHESLESSDASSFRAVVHKCKMTLSFLKDEQLTNMIQKVSEEMKNGSHISPALVDEFNFAVDQASQTTHLLMDT